MLSYNTRYKNHFSPDTSLSHLSALYSLNSSELNDRMKDEFEREIHSKSKAQMIKRDIQNEERPPESKLVQTLRKENTSLKNNIKSLEESHAYTHNEYLTILSKYDQLVHIFRLFMKKRMRENDIQHMHCAFDAMRDHSLRMTYLETTRFFLMRWKRCIGLHNPVVNEWEVLHSRPTQIL